MRVLQAYTVHSFISLSITFRATYLEHVIFTIYEESSTDLCHSAPTLSSQWRAREKSLSCSEYVQITPAFDPPANPNSGWRISREREPLAARERGVH